MADIQNVVAHYTALAQEQFNRVPGSAIFLRYVRSSYQNDPMRSVIELCLFLFAVVYLLRPRRGTKDGNKVVLSEREIDDLIAEWQPDPLTAPLTEQEKQENAKRVVIVGPTGPKTKIQDGKGGVRTVTNLASYNFYNFIVNEELKEKAVGTLRKYGVGPCGPPGFYGTQDVHMTAEEAVARHVGTADAIVYAQAFSTISSAIPAFAKRGDIIVADGAVNYAIRKGLQISRSTVHFYAHNDYEDLERVLKSVVKAQAKKPLTRRFIITEGLFDTTGAMVDLPKLVELKDRYKFRIVLDETWSYGVLGDHGRGVTEHQRVDPTNVDMIIGSLAGPISAGGGFCAGSKELVEHQRIMANAYTFSAALPAMLATTAAETIKLLNEKTELGVKLQENIDTMWGQFDAKKNPKQQWVVCSSARENPIMLLVLKDELIDRYEIGVEEQEMIVQEVIDECLRRDILITKVRHMPTKLGALPREQEWQPEPAIKICLTTGLSKKEVEQAGQTIRRALHSVLEKRKYKRPSSS